MNTAVREKEVQVHFRTCNICEASCGLEIRHQDGRILSIRGDELDPLSQGYLCPKGVALQDLQEDPDRLRRPLKRLRRLRPSLRRQKRLQLRRKSRRLLKVQRRLHPLEQRPASP